MLRLNREAIDTFILVTGVSEEATAIQKLQENLGDLNDAILAYMFAGDRNSVAYRSAPNEDSKDIANAPSVESQSLYSTTCAAEDSSLSSEPSSPTPDDLTDYSDEDLEEILQAAICNAPEQDAAETLNTPHEDYPDGINAIQEQMIQAAIHNAPEQDAAEILYRRYEDFLDNNIDIEEQMVQAAIEASKNDAMLNEANELEYALSLSLQISKGQLEGLESLPQEPTLEEIAIALDQTWLLYL